MPLYFSAAAKNHWRMPSSTWAVPAGVPLTVAGLINRVGGSEYRIVTIHDFSDAAHQFGLNVRGSGVIRATAQAGGGTIQLATTSAAIGGGAWGLAIATFGPTSGVTACTGASTNRVVNASIPVPTGLDMISIGAHPGAASPLYADLYLGGIAIWNREFTNADIDALNTACVSGVGFHEWCLGGDGTLNYGPEGDCNLIRFAGMMLGTTPDGAISNNQLEDWIVQSRYQRYYENSTAGSLTTRTSDTAGSITAVDHEITTGTVISITWSGGSRTGVIAGTIAGDVIPFSGGTGTVLPAVLTAVTVAGIVEGGTYDVVATPTQVSRSFKTIATVPASFSDRLRQVWVNTDDATLIPTGHLALDGGPLQIQGRIVGYFATPSYDDAAAEAGPGAGSIYTRYINWCTANSITPSEGHLVLQNWGLDTGQGDRGDVWDNTIDSDVPGMTGFLPGDTPGTGPPYTGNENHGPDVIAALIAAFTADVPSTMPKWITLEELRTASGGIPNGRRDWEGHDGFGGMRNYLFTCFGGPTLAQQLAYMPGVEYFGGYAIQWPYRPGEILGNVPQQHINMTFIQVTAGTGVGGTTLVVEADFPNTAGWTSEEYFLQAEHFEASMVGRKLYAKNSGKIYEILSLNNGLSVELDQTLDTLDDNAGFSTFVLLAPPTRRFKHMYENYKLLGYTDIRPQLAAGNPYPICFIPTDMKAMTQALIGDYPEVTEVIIQWNKAQTTDDHFKEMVAHTAYYLDPASSGLVYLEVSDAPTGLTLRAKDAATIDLAWTAPADTNGGTIEGYQIDRSADGVDWSVLVADTGDTSTTYRDTDSLVQFDPYFYRVRAITEFGVGAASEPASMELWAPTWGFDPPGLGVDKTAEVQANPAHPDAFFTNHDDEAAISFSADGLHIIQVGNDANPFTSIRISGGELLDNDTENASFLLENPLTCDDFCIEDTTLATHRHALFHGGLTALRYSILRNDWSDKTTTAEEGLIRQYGGHDLIVRDNELANVHWSTGDGLKTLKGCLRIYLTDKSTWVDNNHIVGGGIQIGGKDAADGSTYYTSPSAFITNNVVDHDDGSGPQGVSGNAGGAVQVLGCDDVNLWNNIVSSPRTQPFIFTTGTVLNYDETTAVSAAGGQFIPFDPDVHVEWVDAPTAPDAPTGLTATADGENAIDLAWSAPADDGGVAVTGYKIERESPIGGGFSTLIADTGTTDTTFEDTGLTADTQYNYRVSAINQIGTSDASNEDSATTEGGVGATVPGAPTGLMATVVSTTQIDLSWTAPVDDGGSAILEYRIEINDGGGYELLEATGDTATTYQATGLTQGASYDFRVRAVNAEGIGDPSSEASATTLDVPGAPTGLMATVVSTTQIDLSWTAPADDGGSAILEYRVEIDDGGGFEVLEDTGDTETTYAATGLTQGASYAFRVRAVNVVGVGNASNEASATTLDVPGEPTELAALAVSTTQIDLTWTAPVSDGGSPITTYLVEWESPIGGGFASIDTESTETAFSHTELEPNTEYNYRIVAVNAIGSSDPSVADSATTEALPPEPAASPPSGLAVPRRGHRMIRMQRGARTPPLSKG